VSEKKELIIGLVKNAVKDFAVPSVTEFARFHDPYLVLVSCILSLRTKDKVTVERANALFAKAKSPQEMLGISSERIAKIIYPVGFYHTKAEVIRNLSKIIIRDYKSKVPDTREDLLKIKGIGPKTAALVLGLGFNIPAICVDTHVHRVSNRLGWVVTKRPEDTEGALEKIIPKKYWIGLNTWFVAFGQHICMPVSPYCSNCPIEKHCLKKGVLKSR
jgi:endonuclease-3